MRKELAKLYKENEKLTAKEERGLLLAYKKSLKRARGDIAEIYAKYEVGGKLTYAEMTKYNRLSSMFDGLKAEIYALSGETSKGVTRLAGSVYQDSYYTGAYAIEKSAQAKIGYYKLNTAEVKAAVQNPLSGVALSERLAKNRAELLFKTKAQLTQGLIRGEPYAETAKRLTKVYNGDAKKALRIIRTESHRCEAMGVSKSIDDAEDKGVEFERIWQTSLDSETRDDHVAMDGRAADKDGLFTLPDGSRCEAPGLTGEPSQDINCRCTVYGQIKGFAPGMRRIRGAGVIPEESVTEWKTNRLMSR